MYSVQLYIADCTVGCWVYITKIEIAEIIEVDENEETVDIEEELDDIDKKFDETKGPKLKYK